MKEEPSTYIIDNKDASYYKNAFLNNCKSRTRHINRLYNSLINCKNILHQIIILEQQKDPYIQKDTQIENVMEKIEDCITSIECYNNNTKEEMQDLLARDFEEITRNNTNKIKDLENEKGCKEIQT